MADLFAFAVGDSSSDEGLVVAEAVVSDVAPAPPTPQTVLSVVPSAVCVPASRKKRSGRARNAATRNPRPQPPKLKLVSVAVGASSEENRWLTVLISPSVNAGPKRQREAAVPVTIWPQYTIPLLDGWFVVASPGRRGSR
jgi:hypothetical protein